MHENPTLFHRAKCIEKISTERLTFQNSVQQKKRDTESPESETVNTKLCNL